MHQILPPPLHVQKTVCGQSRVWCNKTVTLKGRRWHLLQYLYHRLCHIFLSLCIDSAAVAIEVRRQRTENDMLIRALYSRSVLRNQKQRNFLEFYFVRPRVCMKRDKVKFSVDTIFFFTDTLILCLYTTLKIVQMFSYYRANTGRVGSYVKSQVKSMIGTY
jgi:hypothetical protein